MNIQSILARLNAFAATFGEWFASIFLALIALGVGALFLYSGGRGLVGYASGIRAAWTEPWVCLLGLVGGTWMVLMSVRLFRGPGPHRKDLLSQPELAILSIGAISGSVWTFTVAPLKPALAFFAVGTAGLVRWWLVGRARRASSNEPAA